jgi:hypothetical protein
LAHDILDTRTIAGRFVNKLAAKFGLFRSVNNFFGPRRYRLCLLHLALVVWIGMVGGGTSVRAADIKSYPATAASPNPQFAIEDFDGDLHPDIASIQAGQTDFSHTDYWIELQLSAAGRQSIRIVGPAGGLIIEARDVNGDHAIDLVLSTAWRRQPVAILLNDGHGTFSRVEPSAIPGAFSASNSNLAPDSSEAISWVGVLSDSGSGLFLERIPVQHFRCQPDSITVSNTTFVRSLFLIPHAGRAPPSEYRYL